MSQDVQVIGRVTFDESTTLEEALEQAEEALEDLDSGEELLDVLRGSMAQDGAQLEVRIDAHFSDEAALWLVDWVDDLLEEADEGYLDCWQEPFGAEYFMRCHAGGQEEKIEGLLRIEDPESE